MAGNPAVGTARGRPKVGSPVAPARMASPDPWGALSSRSHRERPSPVDRMVSDVASVQFGTGRRIFGGMAELEDRLRADLTVAMKSQDKLRTATLRMLLAAIQTEKVSGKQARELTDPEVLKVLAREARKRGEAAQIYVTNGRGELAANERAEATVIEEYLPSPLSEDEIANVVNTAIAQVAEEIGERPHMKHMGQVMKAATAIAAGKADGARLSAAVRARL